MKNRNLMMLCMAVWEREGAWGSPSTRPVRNCNPGDLRSPAGTWEGQTGTDPDGFAIFARFEDGVRASLRDVANHAAANPGQSLYDFAGSYAPASDSNDVDGYALALGKALGVPTNTMFSDL